MNAVDPSAGAVPEDVVVARGLRALRTSLLATVGACLALGVVALAVVLLVAPDSVMLWPGVSLLAVGQLLALTAAAVCGLGLRAVLLGADPAPVRARVARRLRWVARVLLAACLAGILVWGLVRPEAFAVAALCAAVAAQVAAVLYVLYARTLL